MDSLIVELALHISIFIFLSAMIWGTIFYFVFKEDSSHVILAVIVSVANFLVIHAIIVTLMEILQ